jgi:chromosome segregation and condensation protein ScpB
MVRPKRREQDRQFDPELAELPEGARWREWMGRVEAAIFAARDPVPREALAKLVGRSCKLDDLIADIVDESRARPNELVFVAGGYQLRTKPRFSAAIRAASSGNLRNAGAPELTPTELLAATAIAYLQPATRAEISRLAGKEIARDVIGSLKRLDLIDAGLRAPEPARPSPMSRQKSSWRFLGWRRYATFPTSNGSRTRVCCGGPIGNRPRRRLGACRR